jgi:hypothetical protein
MMLAPVMMMMMMMMMMMLMMMMSMTMMMMQVMADGELEGPSLCFEVVGEDGAVPLRQCYPVQRMRGNDSFEVRRGMMMMMMMVVVMIMLNGGVLDACDE